MPLSPSAFPVLICFAQARQRRKVQQLITGHAAELTIPQTILATTDEVME